MNLARFLTLAALSAGVLGCGGAPSPLDRNTEVLRQLPEEDREIALNQGSCVVCKKLRAKEGPRQKSMKTGTPVFYCTERCQAEFEDDLAKFPSALSR